MPYQVAGKHPGPLGALISIFRGAGPSSLSHLLVQLGDADNYTEFMRTVREFLPDREMEMLAMSPLEGAAAFAGAFGERYFPLRGHIQDGQLEELEELTRGIPVDPRGLEYDDYDNLNDYGPEDAVGSLLVDFIKEMGLDREGIRVTLMEEAAKKFPQEALERIPPEGYRLELLEEKLPGTAYQGLLAHARWLCHDTGSFFLDETREVVWQDPWALEWSRANVDGLTHDYQDSMAVEEESTAFFKWLGEDPGRRLAEVLNFLEGRTDRDDRDPRQLELDLGPA